MTKNTTNLDIRYEDADIIICHKPAGIATETKRFGQQDMVSLLKNYRAKNGEPPYIGLVHRLDQPVEGLLVFGKTQAAAASLSKQVQQRSIGKNYCAIGVWQAYGDAVSESVTECRNAISQTGTWTDDMTFDKKNNLSVIAPEHAPQAKKAVLDYRITGQQEALVCFDITLHTGRHHQIRLQMAHHGFPILGDTKYGNCAASQLALCSYRLQFTHPTTGQIMDITTTPKNPAFDFFQLFIIAQN